MLHELVSDLLKSYASPEIRVPSAPQSHWFVYHEPLDWLIYPPVILWANVNEIIGLLMIPKTHAYVRIAWMGYQHFT